MQHTYNSSFYSLPKELNIAGRSNCPLFRTSSSLSLTYCMEIEPTAQQSLGVIVILRLLWELIVVPSSQVQLCALALSQMCVWMRSLCTPLFLHIPETWRRFRWKESWAPGPKRSWSAVILVHRLDSWRTETPNLTLIWDVAVDKRRG